MAEEDLIPVFMPSLAEILALAEKKKGARLTETEVTRLRDGSPCIMMARSRAEQLAEKRGFQDVEPENCWADWHRLRVQMTGNGYLPKIVLCFLGDATLPRKCDPILQAEGIEHEWQDADERMTASFEASAFRVDPSFTDADWKHIAAHDKVLYALSANYTAQDARAVSRSFLNLAGRLLQAGAVALKVESSGIAHGKSRWRELASQAQGDDFWPALFRSYVQMPIQADDDYYTCGLHLLGKPDLIVPETLLQKAFRSPKNQALAAVDLFEVFGQYLLTECGAGRFASGHTFSTAADAPRFRVVWEECTGYEEDEFFFNPFGRWRFADVA